MFRGLKAVYQTLIDLELVKQSHHLLLHPGQLALELQAGGVHHVVLQVKDGRPENIL